MDLTARQISDRVMLMKNSTLCPVVHGDVSLQGKYALPILGMDPRTLRCFPGMSIVRNREGYFYTIPASSEQNPIIQAVCGSKSQGGYASPTPDGKKLRITCQRVLEPTPNSEMAATNNGVAVPANGNVFFYPQAVPTSSYGMYDAALTACQEQKGDLTARVQSLQVRLDALNAELSRQRASDQVEQVIKKEQEMQEVKSATSRSTVWILSITVIILGLLFIGALFAVFYYRNRLAGVASENTQVSTS